MNVHSCNSVNSLITYIQYGNNDQDIICNNTDANYRFWYFSNVFINVKRNVAVYQGHINSEVSKNS